MSAPESAPADLRSGVIGRFLFGRLPRVPPWIVLTVTVLLLVGVGYIDYSSRFSVAWSLVYVIPLLMATWVLGYPTGMVLAALCAYEMYLGEQRRGAPGLPGEVLIINSLLRWGVFTLFVAITSLVRTYSRSMTGLLSEKNVRLQEELRQHELLAAGLARSEEQFKQMAENIREVFWLTDAGKTTMLYVSPAYRDIWGRTCEELYEHPTSWLDSIHPDDRERIRRASLTKQSSGEYNEQYRIIRPDGGVRWIHDRAFPIADKHGRPERVVGVAADITASKEAELQLTMLVHAIESTGALISVTDRDNKFIFLNQALLHHYGYEREELIGRRPDILLADQIPDDITLQILDATIRGGWNGELLNKKKDGTVFPIALGTSPILDPSGTIIGLIGVSRDITEQRRAEEALRQAEVRFRKMFGDRRGQPSPISEDTIRTMECRYSAMDHLATGIYRVVDQLREAAKHVLGFSSLTSHELRNQIAVLRQQLENALQIDKSRDDLRHVVNTTYDAILRLDRTVAVLLKIASMQAGTVVPDYQDITLNKFFADFYAEACLLARAKNIGISYPGTAPVVLRGDPDRLKELLLNLLSNSLRHTPEGGTISISVTPGTDRVTINFSDNGAGIASADLPFIFEGFYRSEHQSNSSIGFGLGLMLVRWIVEVHHGTIAVESAPGMGTAFTITLPLISPPE